MKVLYHIRPYFVGISPQNMALYGTVPSFQDPEIPIDFIPFREGNSKSCQELAFYKEAAEFFFWVELRPEMDDSHGIKTWGYSGFMEFEWNLNSFFLM